MFIYDLFLIWIEYAKCIIWSIFKLKVLIFLKKFNLIIELNNAPTNCFFFVFLNDISLNLISTIHDPSKSKAIDIFSIEKIVYHISILMWYNYSFILRWFHQELIICKNMSISCKIWATPNPCKAQTSISLTRCPSYPLRGCCVTSG